MAQSKPKNERRPGSVRPSPAWLVIGAAAALLGLAVILYPALPAIKYALAPPTPTVPYSTKLTAEVFKNLPSLPVLADKPVPADNRIVIPRIGVDMPILEGADQRVLDRGGIWRIPETSTPVAGGNVVLSGHRWQYLPPSSMTLYLLDKVQDGDVVIVYWQGKEYDYRITGRETVRPEQVEILAPTEGPRLTIFTCTPIYSTRFRLVLYGQLIS